MSRIFPMDMIITPLTIKILLESNPLKSRILVRRLAVFTPDAHKERNTRDVTCTHEHTRGRKQSMHGYVHSLVQKKHARISLITMHVLLFNTFHLNRKSPYIRQL